MQLNSAVIVVVVVIFVVVVVGGVSLSVDLIDKDGVGICGGGGGGGGGAVYSISYTGPGM